MNVENQDVIKTRLFADMLKYMQAFSQLAVRGNLDMARKSAGVQDFITRLTEFEEYFKAHNTQLTISGFEGPNVDPGTTPTMLPAFDAVENNKRAFLTAIASGEEYVPIVWSKALMTQPGQQLPPKYYTMPSVSGPAPAKGSYPVGSPSYADNSALDKIELGTAGKQQPLPAKPATGEFYRFAK